MSPSTNFRINYKHLTAAMTLIVKLCEAKIFCERDKIPLEIGQWRSNLKHMDSVVVQNNPVSINEGQTYVYDNFFPGYIIKYIHVHNLAMKSCGASASVKSGGVGTSSILIILHADRNQEIRSVVDIWGDNLKVTTKPPQLNFGNITSLYLFRDS